jgi:cell division protein FtsB
MTIKKLNTSNNKHLEKISKLEKELEKMKTESKRLESNISSKEEEKPALESGKADATEPTEDNEQ